MIPTSRGLFAAFVLALLIAPPVSAQFSRDAPTFEIDGGSAVPQCSAIPDSELSEGLICREELASDSVPGFDGFPGLQSDFEDDGWGCRCRRWQPVCYGIQRCFQEVQCGIQENCTPDGCTETMECHPVIRCEWEWTCSWECTDWICYI